MFEKRQQTNDGAREEVQENMNRMKYLVRQSDLWSALQSAWYSHQIRCLWSLARHSLQLVEKPTTEAHVQSQLLSSCYSLNCRRWTALQLQCCKRRWMLTV